MALQCANQGCNNYRDPDLDNLDVHNCIIWASMLPKHCGFIEMVFRPTIYEMREQGITFYLAGGGILKGASSEVDENNISCDIMDNAIKLADRREELCKHPPLCFACGTRQVQLVEWIEDPKVAEWKCRHCRAKFYFAVIKVGKKEEKECP